MTSKQSKLLKFIYYFWEENGFAPSYGEMMVHMGLKSKGGVNRLIVALQDRGYVVYIKNRARTVRVVSMPSALLNPPQEYGNIKTLGGAK